MCPFISPTDLRTLGPTVQYFCEQGIASTTRKTYQFAMRRFAGFYSSYDVLTPFPVSYYVMRRESLIITPTLSSSSRNSTDTSHSSVYEDSVPNNTDNSTQPEAELVPQWKIVIIWAATTLCFLAFSTQAK